MSLTKEEEEKEMIPKRIFIVPYRNRHQQKYFFSNYMTSVILQGYTDYEIYFSHQHDNRNFNRGGTKNIGFLAMKEKYPKDYGNITFIFNDVDTMPFANIFSYQTEVGVVKHYYGFRETLGGIVVIKGSDFEKINGFPNFWGWGNEDNTLQTRCNKHRLIVDRSNFCQIGSPNILQLFDGISRLINKKDPWRAKYDKGVDGLQTISNLSFTIDEQSANPKDNQFPVVHPKIFFINITSFDTHLKETQDDYFVYDLREPARKIIHPNKLEMVISSTSQPSFSSSSFVRQKEAMQARINDWTYIPPNPKNPNANSYQQIIQDNKEMTAHIAKMTNEMTKEEGKKENHGRDAAAARLTKEGEKEEKSRRLTRGPTGGHPPFPPNISSFSPSFVNLATSSPRPPQPPYPHPLHFQQQQQQQQQQNHITYQQHQQQMKRNKIKSAGGFRFF